MLHNHAFVFVTDTDFVVPTVVAVEQLLAHARKRIDCIVFLVDEAADLKPGLRVFFKDSQVMFDSIELRKHLIQQEFQFHQNHVPPATLARFWIADCLPNRYKSLVYLDGDIQIIRDISSLVEYDIPEGKIAAATEPHAIITKQLPPDGYLAGLGLSDNWSYFNAGVFVARVASWRNISKEAFEFFLKNSDKCIRHDQSALNAVCRDQRIHLHPAFNFGTKLSGLGLTEMIRPRVLHFMGRQKPWGLSEGRQVWADPYVVWGNRYLAPYRDLLVRAPWLFESTGFSVRNYLSKWAVLYAGARRTFANARCLKDLAARRARFLSYLRSTEFLGCKRP